MKVTDNVKMRTEQIRKLLEEPSAQHTKPEGMSDLDYEIYNVARNFINNWIEILMKTQEDILDTAMSSVDDENSTIQ